MYIYGIFKLYINIENQELYIKGIMKSYTKFISQYAIHHKIIYKKYFIII